MEAQLSWQSTCLTSRGSQVRALLFPPRLMYVARQFSWLERQPVTLEVDGSSPFRVATFASVAQSVEQGTENPCVVGSIPTGGTIPRGFSSSGRAPPCQGGGSEFEPRKPLQMKRASGYGAFFYPMATQPSGKAWVCKTLIPQFKSGWRLQKTSFFGTRFFCLHRESR